MALMALGGCVFQVVGLNSQEIETDTEAVWAEFGRWGLTDGAQFHGMRRPQMSVRGTLFPDQLGGLADYESIRARQSTGKPQTLIRMGRGFTASVLGRVTVERVSDLETYGGKKVAFTVDLKGYS